MEMDPRIPVGVLGATGTVGTRLVALLADHPWFRLAEVGASERSVGRAVGGLRARPLRGSWQSPLLLSALPSGVARSAEERLAGEGHLVVSNASAFRAEPEVPLVIPEVNAHHLELVEAQRSRWAGALVTNPNCVVAGLATALAPLHEAFGLERVVVTSLQAISGAGRPGPSAHDLVDNLLPFIAGEEEKIAAEPRKILGRVEGGRVVDADFRVGATAVRVPVLHGHTVAVSAAFGRSAPAEQVREALRGYRSRTAGLTLPTAPDAPLTVLDEPDRPQPRLDRDRDGGMAVSVGRIRACAAMDVSFVVHAHNLVRGAAGAALLNAELCRSRGLVERVAGARLP